MNLMSNHMSVRLHVCVCVYGPLTCSRQTCSLFRAGVGTRLPEGRTRASGWVVSHRWDRRHETRRLKRLLQLLPFEVGLRSQTNCVCVCACVSAPTGLPNKLKNSRNASTYRVGPRQERGHLNRRRHGTRRWSGTPPRHSGEGLSCSPTK